MGFEEVESSAAMSPVEGVTWRCGEAKGSTVDYNDYWIEVVIIRVVDYNDYWTLRLWII